MQGGVHAARMILCRKVASKLRAEEVAALAILHRRVSHRDKKAA